MRIEYIATINVCADRYVIWPLALTCGFPVVLFILWSGPLVMMFALPFFFSIWIFSALLASGMAFFSAKAHLWRRAFSLSVLPLVSLVGIYSADTVWPLIIEAGESLHFQVMRRSYLEDVSKLPSVGEPRFALWIWGGFIIGHGVVYDESDEILLPEKSPAWNKRVANTEVSCGAWGRPLGNHFYLVRTGC